MQSGFNRLANTGRAWAVGETILSVVQGVGDYDINAANTGKVLDAITYDPTNESWIERQVPFYDYAEMGGDWSQFGGWSPEGTGHSAQRLAFYRRDGNGNLRVRVRPIPTTDAEYLVSYSVGDWATQAGLDDSPLLSNHHHLFTCQIARAALPAAEWWEDEKENRVRRKELWDSLSARINEYNPIFDHYTAYLNTPRNTTRIEAFPIE